MMRRVLGLNLFLVVLVVCVCGLAVDTVVGEMPGQMPGQMPPPGMGPGGMPMGPGGMPGGMPGQNYASYSAVTKSLAELIAMVNTGQVPDKAKLLEFQKVIKENRPKANQTQPKDVCLHYMLQSWTSYYGGDEVKAMQLANNAVRKDVTNKDALKTDAALKLLTGNADKIKITMPTNQAKAQNNMNQFGGFGASASQSDMLDLDLESIRKDMIGNKISPINAICLNGTLFSYSPGQGPLCLMFWQLEETIDPSTIDLTATEPNGAPRVRKKPTPTNQNAMNHGMHGMMPGMPGGMMPGMMPGMGGSYGGNQQKMDPKSIQVRAFGKMFSKRVGSSVKFLAVNTDSFINKDIVIDELVTNGMPWAQVMKEGYAGNKGVDQFDDVKVEVGKPFMVFADRDGVIQYAGSVSGFLTPMVMAKYAGTHIGKGYSMSEAESEAYFRQAKASRGMVVDLTQSPESIKQQSGGRVGIIKAQPEIQSPVVQAKPVEDSTDITVDEVQAQKLYEGAKAQVKIGIKTGSARRGVGLCRDILRKYPTSESADKTRALLRSLPDRYKKKYNITKEEMGL